MVEIMLWKGPDIPLWQREKLFRAWAHLLCTQKWERRIEELSIHWGGWSCRVPSHLRECVFAGAPFQVLLSVNWQSSRSSTRRIPSTSLLGLWEAQSFPQGSLVCWKFHQRGLYPLIDCRDHFSKMLLSIRSPVQSSWRHWFVYTRVLLWNQRIPRNTS